METISVVPPTSPESVCLAEPTMFAAPEEGLERPVFTETPVLWDAMTDRLRVCWLIKDDGAPMVWLAPDWTLDARGLVVPAKPDPEATVVAELARERSESLRDFVTRAQAVAATYQ